MRRRFRRAREIPFSFDSFLDVVANVVGIIIRLILVVWVGARSYSSVQFLLNRPRAVTSEASAESVKIEDPLEAELALRRRELADAQARVLEQLRRLQEAREDRGRVEGQLATLMTRRQEIESARTALARDTAAQAHVGQTAALALEELRKRQQKLLEDIQALEKTPPPTHLLRYQTPVSRPVQSEEFMFECRAGRVTFIDLHALLSEVRRDVEEKSQLLRTRWQVSDVSSPVGSFRLRYVIERERGLVDAVVPGSGPEASGSFRYGVTEMVVEPVALARGETAAAALAKGSEFRRLADTLDPQQAVVTFWVYPDSFGLYRQLRDSLYERDLVVAGRVLPPDFPITLSRNGSLSRGQ